MEKKELKETRIKRYFIDAAKNMIKGEGINSVSVRSVADYAGYSASTLYTYFKDINELLLICILEFIDELNEFINSNLKKKIDGRDKIRIFYNSLVKYFVQYPSIFQLIYIESNSLFRADLEKEKNLGQKLIDFIKSNIFENFEQIYPDKTKYEIEEINRNLYYSILGLLLSYINRNEPKDYKDFLNNEQSILSLYSI